MADDRTTDEPIVTNGQKNEALSSASSRRTFLKVGAAATAAPLIASQAAAAPTTGRVERYARLGRTELEIADISFGSSRLRNGQENLVHHALDLGINYFDTAESYTGGASEVVLGNALRGKREDVILTSKIIAHEAMRQHDFMTALDGSLRRLQTDYVDIYMSHAVNDVDVLANPEWPAFLDAAKKAGKIRFTGISGHAGRLTDCIDYAVEEDIADVILVAHNFGQDPKFYEGLTRSFDFVATQQDLPRALAKAKAKDVGVIAMKTLMGARLNDMRPFERDGATFAQAGFRWVLSNPHVDGLIISMTSEANIDEFLGASGWRSLAYGDRALLDRYAKLHGQTYCRQVCNDCAGACPYNVDIAGVLRTRMYATDYQDLDFARREYAMLASNAAACLSCSGEPCQSACTHGIAISDVCGPTHSLLA